MKILACPDQHWTTRKPKNRTDDYYQTVIGKLQQELSIARCSDCNFILMPGDLFDSFKENHLIVQEIITLFKRYSDIYILAVAGQHDQAFHTAELKGTALGTLIASGSIMMCGKKPHFLSGKEPGNDRAGVAVYGASWKEEIPEITTPDRVNILVTHRMIVDEKLWAQQEGHTWANHILIKNKFDLIVSGDNHKRFSASKGSQHLINCGAMMRSSIAQVDHKPAVAVYDTCKNTFEWVELSIEPMENVMCVEKAEEEKERNLKLEAFVSSLKETDVSSFKLSFVDALHTYIEKNGIDDEVADIIKEALA